MGVGQGLGVCSQQPGHEDYFYGNKLVTTGTNVGGFACDGDAKTVVHGNSYYTASGSISECKMDFKAWQAKGNDKGSTVAALPSDETIIGWAKSMLGFYSAPYCVGTPQSKEVTDVFFVA